MTSKRPNTIGNMSFVRAAAITIVAASVAGCTTDGTNGLGTGSTGQPGTNGQSAGAGQSSAQDDQSSTVARGLRGVPSDDRAKFNDSDNPLSTRTIHFRLDSSSVKSKYVKVLQAHARYLKNHPKVDLRLEGNTDQRGTREYNIALGSRRAKSVKEAMTLSGADSGQISTLSFGEERPAIMGDTKADYAKNRRVVLVYTK